MDVDVGTPGVASFKGGGHISTSHMFFFLKYYTCFLRLFLFVYGTCVILLVGNNFDLNKEYV